MESVNSIEIFAYGLQRSGNHAVLLWIQAQHAGKPACFLNNIKHGDYDPYLNNVQRELFAIDSELPMESVRSLRKHLLIYSYEDDEKQMGNSDDFLKSVFSEDFERNRDTYLGGSELRYEILIIRDPFNFFASRLKKLNALSGKKDPEVIASNWKALARRALNFLAYPEPKKIVASYNDWVSNEGYRRKLSEEIGGDFDDSKMDQITYFGGGSSFDATNEKLTFPQIISNWKKLFEPRRYLKVDHYFRRLTAPDAKDMKVLERWKIIRKDPVFRQIMTDPELLDLSEKLFGEIPGTRDFVRSLKR